MKSNVGKKILIILVILVAIVLSAFWFISNTPSDPGNQLSGAELIGESGTPDTSNQPTTGSQSAQSEGSSDKNPLSTQDPINQGKVSEGSVVIVNPGDSGVDPDAGANASDETGSTSPTSNGDVTTTTDQTTKDIGSTSTNSSDGGSNIEAGKDGSNTETGKSDTDNSNESTDNSNGGKPSKPLDTTTMRKEDVGTVEYTSSYRGETSKYSKILKMLPSVVVENTDKSLILKYTIQDTILNTDAKDLINQFTSEFLGLDTTKLVITETSDQIIVESKGKYNTGNLKKKQEAKFESLPRRGETSITYNKDLIEINVRYNHKAERSDSLTNSELQCVISYEVYNKLVCNKGWGLVTLYEQDVTGEYLNKASFKVTDYANYAGVWSGFKSTNYDTFYITEISNIVVDTSGSTVKILMPISIPGYSEDLSKFYISLYNNMFSGNDTMYSDNHNNLYCYISKSVYQDTLNKLKTELTSFTTSHPRLSKVVDSNTGVLKVTYTTKVDTGDIPEMYEIVLLKQLYNTLSCTKDYNGCKVALYNPDGILRATLESNKKLGNTFEIQNVTYAQGSTPEMLEIESKLTEFKLGLSLINANPVIGYTTIDDLLHSPMDNYNKEIVDILKNVKYIHLEKTDKAFNNSTTPPSTVNPTTTTKTPDNVQSSLTGGTLTNAGTQKPNVPIGTEAIEFSKYNQMNLWLIHRMIEYLGTGIKYTIEIQPTKDNAIRFICSANDFKIIQSRLKESISKLEADTLKNDIKSKYDPIGHILSIDYSSEMTFEPTEKDMIQYELYKVYTMDNIVNGAKTPAR